MFSRHRFAGWVVLGLGVAGIPLGVFASPVHTTSLQARMAPRTAGAGASVATITTSIILNVTHPRALANFIQATVTPGDGQYHRFLSVEEFRERFAPSPAVIHGLVRYLNSYGITVNKIYADHLDITATGTAAAFNAAFATTIRDYDVGGEQFRKPDREPTLPGALGEVVLAVTGLSNEARFHPMNLRLGRGPYAKLTPPPVTWPKNGTATGVPQEYTVGDVANMYDVNPLYRAGIKGRGETIGIMTLADFNAADAYAYWKDIGLKVRPHRIRKVLIDGGTGFAGAVETSLDVEQSGGLAPEAKIVVYEAPNTNNGFLDLFYTAVSDNVADTLSVSWGEAEELYFAALNNGVDYTSQLTAMDQAFMEGAAQGQSVFAAAGDSGAYDINNSQIAPFPFYSMQLTVDAPASAPYITAAGGTTAAATIPGIPQYGCQSIVIRSEQVWGWDYLNSDWANCLGFPPDYLFPTGGGGGVSSFWPVPYYQQSVAGIEQTQPNQSLIFYPNGYPNTAGAQDLIDLPGGFAGRNLPDLSMNADPETGYIVIDCVDFGTSPGCAATGYGGTSFVAPQLNGITALIDEASGGRVGFLNPVLYTVQQAFGYGRYTPFRDITAGDNWFYSGVRGYDNGSGIGTINATNLALTYVFMNAPMF